MIRLAFIAMEFIHGHSLHDIIKKRPFKNRGGNKLRRSNCLRVTSSSQKRHYPPRHQKCKHTGLGKWSGQDYGFLIGEIGGQDEDDAGVCAVVHWLTLRLFRRHVCVILYEMVSGQLPF